MIRVISSPSSSTIGFLTAIFAMRAAMLWTRCERAQSGPMATVERPLRRNPRGLQPAPAAGGLQPLRRRPAAGRGAAPRGRRVGRGADARELGAICGSRQTIRWGFEANENKPELRTHDRYGNRIDEVEFDSSWHELMRIGVGNGLHALALARAGARRPRRPRRDVHAADAGRERGRLPDLDDLLGDPGAAQAARAGRGVGAALPLARLRRALAAGRAQARRPLRDGDDREAGRLRRARQHHRRRRR